MPPRLRFKIAVSHFVKRHKKSPPRAGRAVEIGNDFQFETLPVQQPKRARGIDQREKRPPILETFRDEVSPLGALERRGIRSCCSIAKSAQGNARHDLLPARMRKVPPLHPYREQKRGKRHILRALPNFLTV